MVLVGVSRGGWTVRLRIRFFLGGALFLALSTPGDFLFIVPLLQFLTSLISFSLRFLPTFRALKPLFYGKSDSFVDS